MFAHKLLLNCSITHDECHKSLKFNYPGQNTGFICRTPIISPVEAIQTVIMQWWDEHSSITSIDDNNVFSSIQANDIYDHFTQMARDNAYKLGCATVSTDGGNCYYIACNYAITNWDSDPVYAVGTAQSSCQTQSTTYDGLCGPNEDYTGYTTNGGITFFTSDQTVPNDVTIFINNGRVLFGASDSSTVASTDTQTTIQTTTQTTTQTNTLTDNAVSGLDSSSGSVQSNNQTDLNSGSFSTADTGLNFVYLLICKDKKNCKKSSKKEKKSKKHKKHRKHKKKKSCKKNKSCKSSASGHKTKKIKYPSRKKEASYKH